MDWQPIDTAPEGKRVLLWFPWKDRLAVGEFKLNNYQHPAPDWTSDDGEALTLMFDPPTHWMPLPQPPTE